MTCNNECVKTYSQQWDNYSICDGDLYMGETNKSLRIIVWMITRIVWWYRFAQRCIRGTSCASLSIFRQRTSTVIAAVTEASRNILKGMLVGQSSKRWYDNWMPNKHANLQLKFATKGWRTVLVNLRCKLEEMNCFAVVLHLKIRVVILCSVRLCYQLCGFSESINSLKKMLVK